jgi:hypothetical protein
VFQYGSTASPCTSCCHSLPFARLFFSSPTPSLSCDTRTPATRRPHVRFYFLVCFVARWGVPPLARGASRWSPRATPDALRPACCAGHRPSCPFTLSGSSVGQRGILRSIHLLSCTYNTSCVRILVLFDMFLHPSRSPAPAPATPARPAHSARFYTPHLLAFHCFLSDHRCCVQRELVGLVVTVATRQAVPCLLVCGSSFLSACSVAEQPRPDPLCCVGSSRCPLVLQLD